MLTPEVVLPGHNLCEAGDPADCLWILQSGAAPAFQTCPGTTQGPASLVAVALSWRSA